jgi:hypothetical protein
MTLPEKADKRVKKTLKDDLHIIFIIYFFVKKFKVQPKINTKKDIIATIK